MRYYVKWKTSVQQQILLHHFLHLSMEINLYPQTKDFLTALIMHFTVYFNHLKFKKQNKIKNKMTQQPSDNLIFSLFMFSFSFNLHPHT